MAEIYKNIGSIKPPKPSSKSIIPVSSSAEASDSKQVATLENTKEHSQEQAVGEALIEYTMLYDILSEKYENYPWEVIQYHLKDGTSHFRLVSKSSLRHGAEEKERHTTIDVSSLVNDSLSPEQIRTCNKKGLFKSFVPRKSNR